MESDIPERSVTRIPPQETRAGATWPKGLPRPSILLDPPQPVRITTHLSTPTLGGKGLSVDRFLIHWCHTGANFIRGLPRALDLGAAA